MVALNLLKLVENVFFFKYYITLVVIRVIKIKLLKKERKKKEPKLIMEVIKLQRVTFCYSRDIRHIVSFLMDSKEVTYHFIYFFLFYLQKYKRRNKKNGLFYFLVCLTRTCECSSFTVFSFFFGLHKTKCYLK